VLHGPKHYLSTKTVTEKKGGISAEMFDHSLNVGRQFCIAFDEDGAPWTPAMTSQVKGNRSKPCLSKVSPNVNVTPGMFAYTMNNDNGCDRIRRRVPTTTKKQSPIRPRDALRRKISGDFCTRRHRANPGRRFQEEVKPQISPITQIGIGFGFFAHAVLSTTADLSAGGKTFF
jgi:hypothetical protein